MRELVKELPDAEVVLALAPEELGAKILFLLKRRFSTPGEPNHIHRTAILADVMQVTGDPNYGVRAEAVGLAVSEALAWLESECLLVPKPNDAQSGWLVLARRALAITDDVDFQRYRAGSILPRHLLHPAIADPVWASFVRGDYDTAVFQAMRQVEISLRAVGGGEQEWPAVKLARWCFKPGEGPLCDPDAEAGEQQGMMDLFAGALGALKNPHSHRLVNFESPIDAVASVLFACQLLTIIDRRVRDPAA